MSSFETWHSGSHGISSRVHPRSIWAGVSVAVGFGTAWTAATAARPRRGPIRMMGEGRWMQEGFRDVLIS